jgi:hypothetical protein
VPYTVAHTTGSARGPGDSAVGVKYRYYDNDQTGLSLAIYPQIKARTLGANARDPSDPGETGATVVLPLLLTQEFLRASITANLGLEQGSNHPHSGGFASFGAGTRFTNALAGMAELAVADFNLPDQRRTRLNLGVKRKFSERKALAAGLGYDVQAPADADRQFYATLSYQRLFGSESR